MKLSNILSVKKKCDKCGKNQRPDFTIKRAAIHIHFPFYEYFGFDLCPLCLEELDNLLIKFLNLEQ
jgi:hypothetical protein